MNAEGIDEADRNAYRQKHRQQISAKKSYQKRKREKKAKRLQAATNHVLANLQMPNY